MALLLTLAAQGWNILGGYGGQYSFGHAAFFGTGAYATAILQMRYGLQCLAGFRRSASRRAPASAPSIGALTFRSGLRGSYFALVTLAFAEVLRIVASVAPITGAGVGIADQARCSAPQRSSSRAGRLLLVHPGAGRRRARRHASDRAIALRRMAGGGARERGRRHARSASMQPASSSAR